MSHGPATNINPPVLRHAFVLLAGAELERVPDWSGPDDPSHLLTRVELLAVLLNVIPRSQLHQLDAVAENWLVRFPAGEVATVQHLRVSARSVLQKSDDNEAEPKASDSATQFLQQIFGMPVGKEDRKASRSFSAVIRKRCVEVLDGWATQVKSEPEWRTLPNVVPGEQRTPIEQVYVDLTTLPKTWRCLESTTVCRPNDPSKSWWVITCGPRLCDALPVRHCHTANAMTECDWPRKAVTGCSGGWRPSLRRTRALMTTCWPHFVVTQSVKVAD